MTSAYGSNVLDLSHLGHHGLYFVKRQGLATSITIYKRGVLVNATGEQTTLRIGNANGISALTPWPRPLEPPRGSAGSGLIA